MSNILNYLKNKQLVWQASNPQQQSSSVSPSGYPDLDAFLLGGFPESGVVDIQSELGIGELRLFLHALRNKHEQQSRLLVFIAPPMRVNSEMLAEAGFDLTRVIIVQPRSVEESLWAAEQCLKSDCCHTVINWQQKLQVRHVKRLQLAAEQGEALQLVFRYATQGEISLPVSLSMSLDAHPKGLTIKVNKRIGGWQHQPFHFNMRPYWPALTLAEPDNLVSIERQRVG